MDGEATSKKSAGKLKYYEPGNFRDENRFTFIPN